MATCFLDFAAGIAVVSTGHCHPDVVRAIQKQAETLIHMSGTDFYYPLLAQLAEKMARITPGTFPKRVAFGNSGTEAMEAAMKIARYHTKRHRFIAFLGGVSRADLRRAFAHGQQGGSAARVRPSSAGRRPRAVCQSLSLPARSPRTGLRLRLRMLRLDRTAIVQDVGAARGSGGHRCGTDSG